jgi:excisionase family DNA binding protein
MTADNLRSSASLPRLVEHGWTTRKPVQSVRNRQVRSLEQREGRLATEDVPKSFKRPYPEKLSQSAEDIPDVHPHELASQIERYQRALTVSELASILTLSRQQIYCLVKRGHIPSIKIAGTIRLDPVITARWLRSLAA